MDTVESQLREQLSAAEARAEKWMEDALRVDRVNAALIERMALLEIQCDRLRAAHGESAKAFESESDEAHEDR